MVTILYHLTTYVQNCQQVRIFRILYGNLSNIRLSWLIQINTDFWKTTQYYYYFLINRPTERLKEMSPDTQRAIHVHRILALFCPRARTHPQAVREPWWTARGTSCSFVALRSMRCKLRASVCTVVCCWSYYIHVFSHSRGVLRYV